MDQDFIDRVYDTLQGNLTEDACVPGVENLFAAGRTCDLMYEEIHAAYNRILQRLDAENEDPDLEIILNAFLVICKETGQAMYRLGARFGQSSPGGGTQTQPTV